MARERNIRDAKSRGATDDSVTRESVGQNIPTDFKLARLGIEEVDRAIFKLFDQDIGHLIENSGPHTINEGPGTTQNIPVIFATGERFALVKRRKPLRDKNGQIILPLISIRRTGMNVDTGIGRGVAQDVGGLKIKKRLSSKDRDYQNLINKLGLRNQDNLSTRSHFIDQINLTGSFAGQTATRRPGLGVTKVHTGGLLEANLGKNIFEVLEIPFPNFYTLKYEIIYWAQYTQHMNSLLQQFMNSLRGQGDQFILQFDNGYYLVAYQEGSFTPQDNVADFSGEERILKYSVNLEVPAWLFETGDPGQMSGVRRYLSAPTINFSIYDGAIPIGSPGNGNFKSSGVPSGDIDKFMLSDVELLDKDGNREPTDRFQPNYTSVTRIDEITGKKITRRIRIKDRNQRKGETVLDAKSLKELERFIT
jgi:hypothetical protein